MGNSAPYEPDRLRDLRSELMQDPDLVAEVERCLGASTEAEIMVIRTDGATVDRAIARALALTVHGIAVKVELL